jgi:transposase InsO family protein
LATAAVAAIGYEALRTAVFMTVVMEQFMSEKRPGTAHGRWAEFRFGVVGSLLSAQPPRGELEQALQQLAAQDWTHPITGEPTRFAVSTIARWYYTARGNPDNIVGSLRPKVRKDRGCHRAHFSEAVWEALAEQYSEHPSWTYQLHADNLKALCEEDPKLGPSPKYSTVRRHMKSHGWLRVPRRRDDDRPGAQAARISRSLRETRSWEKSHVHALWHLDFKDSPLPVITRTGERKHPHALGVIDNRSRLSCHLQWYLGEGAEELTHALGQALQKRGKPRGVMMDNGPAMKAGETRQGLIDLGITLVKIPDYCPEHNAIIEAFWKQITLRLMPMLEGIPDLTLALLNEATQAFVEFEYNCSIHSETGQTPIERLLAGPSAVRDAPTAEQVRQAFRLKVDRKQRASDGTVSLGGVRFEVPSCYRHLSKLTVRYARWDLSSADLWDDALGVVLATIYPVDREANASGFRRPLAPVPSTPRPPKPSGMAPLLRQYVEQHRQTGLPPAYLPKDDLDDTEQP